MANQPTVVCFAALSGLLVACASQTTGPQSTKKPHAGAKPVTKAWSSQGPMEQCRTLRTQAEHAPDFYNATRRYSYTEYWKVRAVVMAVCVAWPQTMRDCLHTKKAILSGRYDCERKQEETESAPYEKKLIARMKRFTEEMCTCADASCTKSVDDRMNAWVIDAFKGGRKKGSKKGVERWKKQHEKYRKCQRRVTEPPPNTGGKK